MFGLKWQGSQAEKFYNIIYDELCPKLEWKYNRFTNIMRMDQETLALYYGKGSLHSLDKKTLFCS